MLIQADARSLEKGRIKAMCPTCGRTFITWACRRRIGQGKFCSHSCSQKARLGSLSSRWTGGQVDRECLICGAAFRVDPVQVKLGKAKYCSWTCQHQSIDVQGEKNPQYKHGLSETPEYRRHRMRLRRARVRKASGTHDIHDIVRLNQEQCGKCPYCDCRLIGFHVDHKTPLIRGGTNDATNLQLLCATCNMRKHTRTHEEYLLAIGQA